MRKGWNLEALELQHRDRKYCLAPSQSQGRHTIRLRGAILHSMQHYSMLNNYLLILWPQILCRVMVQVTSMSARNKTGASVYASIQYILRNPKSTCRYIVYTWGPQAGYHVTTLGPSIWAVVKIVVPFWVP